MYDTVLCKPEETTFFEAIPARIFRCIVRDKLLSKELFAIYRSFVEVVRLDVLVIENYFLKQLANQGHFGCITRKGAKVGRLQQRAFSFVLSMQIKLVFLCTCAQCVELLGIP